MPSRKDLIAKACGKLEQLSRQDLVSLATQLENPTFARQLGARLYALADPERPRKGARSQKTPPVRRRKSHLREFRKVEAKIREQLAAGSSAEIGRKIDTILGRGFFRRSMQAGGVDALSLNIATQLAKMSDEAREQALGKMLEGMGSASDAHNELLRRLVVK